MNYFNSKWIYAFLLVALLVFPTRGYGSDHVQIVYPAKSSNPVLKVGANREFTVVVKYDLETTPSAILRIRAQLDHNELKSQIYEIGIGSGKKTLSFPLSIDETNRELILRASLSPEGSTEPDVDKLVIPCVFPDLKVKYFYDQAKVHANGNPVTVKLVISRQNGEPVKNRKFALSTMPTNNLFGYDSVESLGKKKAIISTDAEGEVSFQYFPILTHENSEKLENLEFPLIRKLELSEIGGSRKYFIKLSIDKKLVSNEKIEEKKHESNNQKLSKPQIDKVLAFPKNEVGVSQTTFKESQKNIYIFVLYHNIKPGYDSIKSVMYQGSDEFQIDNFFPTEKSGSYMFKFHRPKIGWSGPFTVKIFNVDEKYHQTELNKIKLMIK